MCIRELIGAAYYIHSHSAISIMTMIIIFINKVIIYVSESKNYNSVHIEKTLVSFFIHIIASFKKT
jgi:hypothetical protein